MAFDLQPPTDDELHKETVGPWTQDKHHFLRRYIDAFTTAMRQKWRELHYIDLFSGPGIVEIKIGPLDWGSPLIAAQSPHQFTRLHLCDLRKRNIDVLKQRLQRYPQPNPPQVLCGDANKVVTQVLNEIPSKSSLSLAFLDPHGLHLDFDTLAALSKKKVDLIIFFPDHLDALRNWENVYQGKPDSNLNRVLGRSDWLDVLHKTSKGRWAEALQSLYIERIKTLGYDHFEDERISLPTGRFLYKLIFCSEHPLGAQLWRRTSQRKPDGQLEMDFG